MLSGFGSREGEQMAVFALLGLLPLLAYCIIQTFRDARRKTVIMAVWGAILCGLLIWMVVRVFQQPGF
jgi:drug/metabolite transporter superfamily protein YnfA